MIGRKLHIGAPAAQTLTTVMIYKRYPFGGGEFSPGSDLLCAPPGVFRRTRRRVFASPTIKHLPFLVAVVARPSRTVFFGPFSVGLPPLVAGLPLPFGIVFVPLPGIGLCLFRVTGVLLFAICLLSFGIGLPPLAGLLLSSFGVLRVIPTTAGLRAWHTIALLVPLVSAALYTGVAIFSRHQKTPMASHRSSVILTLVTALIGRHVLGCLQHRRDIFLPRL